MTTSPPDKYGFLTEPVYTQATLAKALGISSKTIRRVYATGALRVIRPGLRDLIILREDAVAWLDERASRAERLHEEVRATVARFHEAEVIRRSKISNDEASSAIARGQQKPKQGRPPKRELVGRLQITLDRK
jgi:hypothetical protein